MTKQTATPGRDVGGGEGGGGSGGSVMDERIGKKVEQAGEVYWDVVDVPNGAGGGGSSPADSG